MEVRGERDSMTRKNVALATFTCTEVYSSPLNRRLDEAKAGEHVEFSNGAYLFVRDPALWGAFKVGEKYELRAAAEPEVTSSKSTHKLSAAEPEAESAFYSPRCVRCGCPSGAHGLVLPSTGGSLCARGDQCAACSEAK
jgi:hypothetical protein